MFTINWFMRYAHLGVEAVFSVENLEAADRDDAINQALARWEASASGLHATAMELHENDSPEAFWRYPTVEPQPLEINTIMTW